MTLFSSQLLFVVELERTSSARQSDKCIDNMYLDIPNCQGNLKSEPKLIAYKIFAVLK